MAYWDCPRCAAENSLDAHSCWRCGYQYFPGYGGAKDPAGSGETRKSIQGQRERLAAGIRKDLEDALERSKAPLERLAGDRRDTAGKPGGPGPTPGRPVVKSRSHGRDT